jgi:hypothetical protein
VPKADLTLIQSSPEVRELDVDWFRLQLLDWEDNESSIYMPKTHTHNTEVTLAGLTYARIVEILSPYTVEFENGTYTINCVGANHNISDKKVANSVSLIVNNAAGLITNAAIEYSSYGDKVTLDPNSSYSGTLFPVGTPQQPVNNLADALLIAGTRGFIAIEIYDDLAIDDTYNLDGFRIQGRTSDVVLQIDSVASVSDLTVENLTLNNSTLDGGVEVRNCMVEDITYVNGFIGNSGLIGTITLGGDRKSVISDCYTADQDDPPIIDMGGSGNDLAMPNYSGIVTIRNLSSASNEIGIGLDAGYVTLDSTITAGTIIVSGIGLMVDNSTGTSVVNTDGILNKALISAAVWDENIGDHLISGTTGRSIGIQQFSGAVHVDPTSGISGTTFPNGTERNPVDNMTDALAIALANGITTFNFHYNTTITGGTYQGYTFIGRGRHSPTLTISNAVMLYCQFKEIKITGTFGANSIIGTYFCALEDVYDICIQAYESIFYGTITLTNGLGSNESNFYTCTDGVPGIGIPDIQLNTCDTLGIWNWNGGIRLSNISTVDTEITCMIAQGRLWVDNTCVEGDIIVKGLADLRGTTGGTTIDSEGLITKDTLNESAWESQADFIYVDLSSAYSGEEYPVGTSAQPVNNLTDALAIANRLGVRAYKLRGQVVFTTDYDKWRFHGWTAAQNDVFVAAGCNITNCNFEKIAVTGTFGASTSNNELLTGFLSATTGFNAVLVGVGITGTYTMGGEGSILLGQQVSWVEYPHTLDMVGVNRYAKFQALSGDILVTNMGAGSLVQCTFSGGSVTLDSSCTGGTLILRGGAHFVDNSGGAVTVTQDTYDAHYIADEVWSSTSGLQVLTDLSFIAGIEGGRWIISGGQMIFYLDDNTTEIARFDLTYDANQNPVERTRL